MFCYGHLKAELNEAGDCPDQVGGKSDEQKLRVKGSWVLFYLFVEEHC